AVKKSDRRSLIRAPSIALPRSSASLSSGDEVPHIFRGKSRLQRGKFLIGSAKGLLQQYLPAADIMHRSEIRAYSITWSATSSRSREISRSSDLAVFRLMTSSYLVGCSTGRSAGFVPFRILPTEIAARREGTVRAEP